MMLRDRDNLNLVERGGGGEITCNQSDREEKQQGRRRRRMDGWKGEDEPTRAL